jgi:hypothetical protein
MLPVFIVTLGILVVTNWVGIEYGSYPGLWSAVGTTTILAILSVLGALYFFYRKPRARYEVEGVTVEFNDAGYYVPERVFNLFLEQIHQDFGPHIEEDSKKLLSGSTLILEKHKPRSVRGERMGLTWPEKKLSRVWAPYVVDRDTAGYELKLIIMGQVFPGQEEGKDIEWMKERGIV